MNAAKENMRHNMVNGCLRAVIMIIVIGEVPLYNPSIHQVFSAVNVKVFMNCEIVCIL